MRISRQTPDQVAECCLRNSAYAEAGQQAADYRARLRAGDLEPGEAVPYGLSAEPIYAMEESAARVAAILHNISGGAFDTADAIEALRSVGRVASLLATAAEALAARAELATMPMAGEA